MAQSEKAKQFQSDIMATITQTVVDQITAGTAPWQKPWQDRNPMARPQNLASGHLYKGLNAMYLGILGAASGCDFWVGAKQGMALGGKPVKGGAVYILAPMTRKWTDDDGESHFAVTGFKVVKVFNAATGFTGLDEKIAEKTPKPDATPRTLDAPRLDTFAAGTGADIRHGGDRAFYNPGSDFVQLPEKDQFHSEAGYYGTLLHELVHWTGHKSRFDRLDDKSKRGYAFEELIAELGAYYASERLGCPNEAENHSSYLDSWLKALASDPRYLWDAASRAEKAADWLIDEAGKAADKAA